MTPSTQRQGGSMMSKWPDLVCVRYFGDACAIVDIESGSCSYPYTESMACITADEDPGKIEWDVPKTKSDLAWERMILQTALRVVRRRQLMAELEYNYPLDEDIGYPPEERESFNLTKKLKE